MVKPRDTWLRAHKLFLGVVIPPVVVVVLEDDDDDRGVVVVVVIFFTVLSVVVFMGSRVRWRRSFGTVVPLALWFIIGWWWWWWWLFGSLLVPVEVGLPIGLLPLVVVAGVFMLRWPKIPYQFFYRTLFYIYAFATLLHYLVPQDGIYIYINISIYLYVI